LLYSVSHKQLIQLARRGQPDQLGADWEASEEATQTLERRADELAVIRHREVEGLIKRSRTVEEVARQRRQASLWQATLQNLKGKAQSEIDVAEERGTSSPLTPFQVAASVPVLLLLCDRFYLRQQNTNGEGFVAFKEGF